MDGPFINTIYHCVKLYEISDGDQIQTDPIHAV